MQNKWFNNFKKNNLDSMSSKRRLRLYCFHHAGGSCQMFQPWVSKLSNNIEVIGVQLPGRWDRINEEAFLDLVPLINVLGPIFEIEIAAHNDQPYAFYGHSLGALIAYELTRFLRNKQLALPVHLFLSSKIAPQLPSHRNPIYALPGASFEQIVTDYYGPMPAEILADADIKKMFLDITRKDMQVLDTYINTPDIPLNIPFTVLVGTSDKMITLDKLEPWRELTSAKCDITQLPGDHFFLKQSEQELLKIIESQITPYLD